MQQPATVLEEMGSMNALEKGSSVNLSTCPTNRPQNTLLGVLLSMTIGRNRTLEQCMTCLPTYTLQGCRKLHLCLHTCDRVPNVSQQQGLQRRTLQQCKTCSPRCTLRKFWKKRSGAILGAASHLQSVAELLTLQTVSRIGAPWSSA